MFELTIKAATHEDLRLQLMGLLSIFKGINYQKSETKEPIELPDYATYSKAEAPDHATSVSSKATTAEPVISQAQMEENIANAPAHEEPKQPTLEEVRAAMKALRDKKGAGAVRELLKAYGADSLPDLKPEDYLGALSRAQMEVE